MSDADLLARALWVALTGAEPDGELPAGTGALVILAERGWDPAAILGHAVAVVAAGGVWPHPVPPDLRAAVGAARLRAVLAQVVGELGVGNGPVVARGARPLNADERRLMADRPPHHLG
jgi:hypothetical protein